MATAAIHRWDDGSNSKNSCKATWQPLEDYEGKVKCPCVWLLVESSKKQADSWKGKTDTQRQV